MQTTMTSQEWETLDMIVRGQGLSESATLLDLIAHLIDARNRLEKIVNENRKDRIPEWLIAVGDETILATRCLCWTCRCASAARLVDKV